MKRARKSEDLIDKEDGRKITPYLLLEELDRFLSLRYHSGSSDRYSSRQSNESRTSRDDDHGAQVSLFLLRNLPAARTAVLTNFAYILSKQVADHVRTIGLSEPTSSDKQKEPENNIAWQLEELLEEMVESSPKVWGPIVAEWSVDKLGQWSLEWDVAIVGRRDSTLEERVASWLSCVPARSLASLTITCVAHDPDATVAALLEASGRSGPTLDWLVAHVGCSFPATVISRVLLLGLKSMTQNPCDMYHLNSINVILDHLADRHLPEIHRGLHGILSLTFTESQSPEKEAAVPYLLKLASSSKRSYAVLTGLTTSLDKVIGNKESLSILSAQFNWWIPKYFPDHLCLLEIVIRLLLETEGTAAASMVCLLLKGLALSTIPASVTKAIRTILSSAVGKMCRKLYTRQFSDVRVLVIPLLVGMAEGLNQVCWANTSSALMTGGLTVKREQITVLPTDEFVNWNSDGNTTFGIKTPVVARRLCQLLTLQIAQQGSDSGVHVLINFLRSSITDSSCVPLHRYVLTGVISAIVKEQISIPQQKQALNSAVAVSLQKSVKYEILLSSLQNLESLVVFGKVKSPDFHFALINAVLDNLPKLTHLVNYGALGSHAMNILSNLPLSHSLQLSHLQCVVHATVFFFLSTLQDGSIQEKFAAASKCDRTLGRLCGLSIAHTMIIRLLIEAAFRSEWSYLFGSIILSESLSKWCSMELLTEVNKQFDSWVKLPQSHVSIFHTGVINKGNKAGAVSVKEIPSHVVKLNTQLLINLIGSCCRPQVWGQAAATIGLVLVELISPDIMFNGFPWPEENIKFTFERDLAIKKTFDEFPVAWEFLKLIASCRPALCYCSVLVRALTAALTSHWNACTLSKASHLPSALESTKRLLSIMVVGQFLPGPLQVLPQMLDNLDPYEVVCILRDVWTYQENHTPSPDRWPLMPSHNYFRHFDTSELRCFEISRKIIQAHITELGHLLPSILPKL